MAMIKLGPIYSCVIVAIYCHLNHREKLGEMLKDNADKDSNWPKIDSLGQPLLNEFKSYLLLTSLDNCACM